MKPPAKKKTKHDLICVVCELLINSDSRISIKSIYDINMLFLVQVHHFCSIIFSQKMSVQKISTNKKIADQLLERNQVGLLTPTKTPEPTRPGGSPQYPRQRIQPGNRRRFEKVELLTGKKTADPRNLGKS